MFGIDSGCATQWNGSCSERQGNENVNGSGLFHLVVCTDRGLVICLCSVLYSSR